MSHYNKLFNQIPVQIQNRSGFDMSHSRYFTATVGTLTPCLCAEVMPGDKITLGAYGSVKLPPFASDFVGRIDAHFEYFFVPNRIIYGGWQRLMTAGLDLDPGTPTSVSSIQTYCPYFSGTELSDLKVDNPEFFAPGSLCDYLGLRIDPSGLPASFPLNALPFLAYHKIWDDWYRDSRLQKPCFPTYSDGDTDMLYNIPFHIHSAIGVADPMYRELYNGFDLFSLHQRNFMKDYFVNASLRPQSANASSLKFVVSDSFGEFTIAALRAANSLQMFMERNNIAGFKYSDQIRAQFGVTPSDAVLNKAIYLGRVVLPVYNSAVVQTSNSTGTETSSRFKSVGASYGRASAIGDGSVFDNFEATEHGFLIGIFSLVPHAVYSTSTSRHFMRIRRADFVFPLLAGVGDQDIYNFELCSSSTRANETFGYTQRFSEMKYIDDTVHGLLRDGGNLSYMVLQRSFDSDSVPVLSSSFIEIPTTYLDDVFAASNEVSGFSCWVNLYHSLKMSRVLPAYSIPTLENPSDVHTEMIPNGGKRL